MSEGQEIPGASWDNTRRLVERISKQYPQLYEEPFSEAPHGLFAGRKVIGRDMTINGGVYCGSGPREAIVVDDRQFPNELQQTMHQLEVALKQGKGSGKSIFEYVFEVTQANLGGNKNPSDLEQRVEQIAARITRIRGSDATVPLNLFIKEGVGVCRHRALLAGYLLEQLIKQGRLYGRVSVDRNTIPGLGGHAWVRHESLDGKVTIIDPSLGYVGPIERAPKIWSYERPK